MSSKFRARSGDNGISDLLREVAQRNSSSLSDDQRSEVSAMVERVEKHRAEVLKKKLEDETTMATTAPAEETTTTSTTDTDTDTDTATDTPSPTPTKTDKNNDNDNDGASQKSSKVTETNHTTGPEAVNKWGKDIIQKFSNLQTTPRKDQATTAASSTSKLDPKEVFRSFSASLPQNPLKHTASSQSQSKPKQPTAFQKEAAIKKEKFQKEAAIKKEKFQKEAAIKKEKFQKEAAIQKEKFQKEAAIQKEKVKQRMEKMKVDFERSSQSGRTLMKNFSNNFKKNLENLENFLLSPAPPEPPKAELDKSSAEYQMDLKGIALLKQIFPEESNETLIKLHFEHLQASNSAAM